MNVTPVAGALGAFVEGVDLARLNDQEFAAVHRAFLDHQVLFFRRQTLTPSSLKAFARRFGPLYVHPYAKSLPDHPEIMPVVREPQDVGRLFGGSWHTDLTFEPEPVLGSALYALDVPSFGGDTMFASQTAAYEGLSDGLKRVLASLDAVHSASESYGEGKTAAAQGMGLKSVREIVEVTHPVVRVHPETKRPGLFVNKLNTRRFAGWTEAESAPLLDYLFRQSVRPEITCRFRWDSGSLALWDNRCVQHIALNDYAGQRREMQRVTICGDRPFGL